MEYLVLLEGGHGLETPGKRTDYISEIGRRIKENEFNDVVVSLMIPELKRHNIHVVDVAPGRSDVSLRARTNKANQVYREYCAKYGKSNVQAIYLSIHYDAHTGSFSTSKGEGHSLFIYPGSTKGRKLAEHIAVYLRQGTTQKWRGIKEQNFHVLRETIGFPAVLSENGFMDNKREALLMIDSKFQREVAVEHVKGALAYFNIPYREEVKQVEKKIHWADKHIQSMIEKKIMVGRGDGKFYPDEPVTRAELAKVADEIIRYIKE